MVLDIARGLRSAGALTDADGNAGRLDFGVMADRVGARALLMAKHRLTREWGEMAAFASVDVNHSWGSGWEARALAGIRIEW